jgi:predicted  nucleic acid-binding Zn-ribbon protein
MKSSVALAILSVAAGVAATSTETGANPIRKVVTLMQDMQKEIIAEGEKEEELYKKFECYCSGNKDELVAAVDSSEEEIERLTAKLKSEKAEKKQLEGELLQAKKDRADAKQDLAKATKLRAKEHETYVKDAGDTKSNIDATNSAITALEKGSGSAGFLQTASGAAVSKSLQRVISTNPAIEAEDRQAIAAFIAQSGDYVPQSGQIIGILKNMKDEMDKSLGGIVSEEESAASGFAGLKGSKNKEISALTEAIESKTKRSGELAVSIVQAQNASDDETDDVTANKKFLVNLEVTCKEKAEEMEARTRTRQEEVAAISEAISILNDDDALDIFKASLPSPANPAFLQFGGEPAAAAKKGPMVKTSEEKKAEKAATAKKAVEEVKKVIEASKQACKDSSTTQCKAPTTPAVSLLVQSVLSKLSSKSKSGVDFSSVLKMIDDMVSLLGKEQEDDTKHKDWCNGEFDSSSDEAKDLNLKVEALVSSISELSDEIANLAKNIAAANSRISDLDKSVAEATAQRKKEHAEYTEAIQLNEAAIQLIFKAKNRLQKFYNPGQYVEAPKRAMTEEDRLVNASGGTVDSSMPAQMIAGTTQTVNFVQIRSRKTSAAPPPPPETFGEYKSKGQKSGGIMGLMDMLTKELETTIQQAEHDEKTANKDYSELVADAQESRSGETKSISGMEGNKANLENVLEETKREHIIKTDQLQQTQTYIGELHQSCDFILANFELRAESRSKEVESLKNAKAVLSGASFSF